MSLNLDAWIYPDGSAEEMGHHEHVVVALREMLKLPDDAPIPREWWFSALPKDALAKAKRRGVGKKELEFLAHEPNDPRTFAVMNYGWIRASKGKFNLHEFNDETLDSLRKAKGYWDSETSLGEYDMADIDELATNDFFAVAVKRIRSYATTAQALKHVAQGVGQYGRNPAEVGAIPGVEFTPTGKEVWYGDSTEENPIRWESGPTQEARLLVGFTIGKRGRRYRREHGLPLPEPWELDDLVQLVYRVRRGQLKESGYKGKKVGVTFSETEGLWRSPLWTEGEPEHGVQILVVNTEGEKPMLFRNRMVELAEIIAGELEQDEVIVSHQRFGKSTGAAGIGAKRRKPHGTP